MEQWDLLSQPELVAATGNPTRLAATRPEMQRVQDPTSTLPTEEGEIAELLREMRTLRTEVGELRRRVDGTGSEREAGVAPSDGEPSGLGEPRGAEWASDASVGERTVRATVGSRASGVRAPGRGTASTLASPGTPGGGTPDGGVRRGGMPGGGVLGGIPERRMNIAAEEIRRSRWFAVNVDHAVAEVATGDDWWAGGWTELGARTPVLEEAGGRGAHRRELARRANARWVAGRWVTRGVNGGLYIYAKPGVWALVFGPADPHDSMVRGPTLSERDCTLDGFVG